MPRAEGHESLLDEVLSIASVERAFPSKGHRDGRRRSDDALRLPERPRWQLLSRARMLAVRTHSVQMSVDDCR